MAVSIQNYYNQENEQNRLNYENSLERIRSNIIIERYLGSSIIKIIDIGGGAGIYSFWLASKGHRVTLIDLMEKHVQQATVHNITAAHKLESIKVGNACKLEVEDSHFDLALLMGPMYHLIDKKQRVLAIQEGMRVLKDNGIMIIAAICRYASLLDGFKWDLINDQDFREILDRVIKTGDHINNTNNTNYFTTSHFHTEYELCNEIEEAGYIVEKVIPVEGFANGIKGIEQKLDNNAYREYLLKKIEETECDKTLIGISSHIIAVVKKERRTTTAST